MRRPFFQLAIALTMLLAGCRQGAKDGPLQTNTFRQTTAERQPQADSATETESTTADVTNVDLLKQRVARGTPEIMLTRKGYVTSYNKQRRTPNWVAWTLTKAHTYGDVQRTEERFEEDTDVPEPRATFGDFYNSRYDRGHLCPAGDNKWDAEAMTQSFLLTNICPQNHSLNKDAWNDLEMQCRSWARRYGELTIVCGPLFEDERTRTIGRNRVSVPSGFFKVVIRQEPQPQAVAFIFKNDGSTQPWREQVCTVDEVERRTGIDFFWTLPDNVEDTIEANDDLQRFLDRE